ncbi:MAG: hypothetical protein EAZ07_06620 [Cytophagales bacterium]|nr:MAG: hypothetical protein EAZ07_06620 [Cytophagales bacterium]
MFKSSISSIMWIVVRTISSFIVNKMISIHYGPQGIILLAHLQNIYSSFILICNEGINKGLIKEYNAPDKNQEYRNQVYTSGLVLTGIVFIIIVILGIVFHPFISKTFFLNGIGIWKWFFVATLGIVFLLIQYLLLSVFLANQKTIVFNTINSIGSIATVFLVYFAIVKLGFSWAILAVVSGLATTTITTVVFFIFFYSKYLHIHFAINKQIYNAIFNFVIIAVGVMAFGKITEIGVRQIAMNYFPADQVGYWQAVVKLSDFYTTAFTSLIAINYFPRLVSIVNDDFAIRKFVFQYFKIFFPLALMGFVIVYVAKDELLLLLFSKEFLPGRAFISWQIIADVFKFISFFLSYLLFAQSRTKTFLLLESSANLVYLISGFLLCQYFEIKGIMFAQIIHYIYYFIFLLIIYKKMIWFNRL